jgi:two-component system sensor histidine kinase KdpD
MEKNIPYVLVCINDHPKSAVLLKAAANMAKLQQCSWEAIYVETTEHYQMSREARGRILRLTTLAEQMGGRAVHVQADNLYEGILGHITQHEGAVLELIIGKREEESLWRRLKRSPSEQLLQSLSKQGTRTQLIPLSGNYNRTPLRERLSFAINFQTISIASVSTAVAYAVIELPRLFPNTLSNIGQEYIIAIYLLACVFTALRCGFSAGILAVLFSIMGLCYSGSRSTNLFTFLPLALFAILISASHFSTRMALLRKERRARALYEVHQLSSEANEMEEALRLLHEKLTEILEMELGFFLPPATNPEAIELAYPSHIELSQEEQNLVQHCWEELRTTGLGTVNQFNESWRFEPMATPNGEIGVVGVKVPLSTKLDAGFGRLLSALADQLANILERIELSRMMGESKIREEREKLRAMLLSSVSHDLKTPLASIIGSLSVHQRMRKSGKLTDEIADELTQTALDEAHRLEGFITNILDMTRLESGDITFSLEWVSHMQLIKEVQQRLKQRLMQHGLVVEELEANTEIYCDRMMTAQVLQNLLDNAAKYAPKGTEIRVSFQQAESAFSLLIHDLGDGIPEEKLVSIFDKYERLEKTDKVIAGTGLGLAICKAIMEKQGGTIEATNHKDGGALFTLNFPQYRIVHNKND